MQYNGFRSIREYESECARLGFTTRRVVVTSSISLASGQAQKLTHSAVPPLPTESASLGFGGDPKSEDYILLITTPPGHPTGTSIESWTLFDAGETRQLLDGVINGHGANYLGKLAAHGYRPDAAAVPQDAPQSTQQPAAQLIDDNGQFCLAF